MKDREDLCSAWGPRVMSLWKHAIVAPRGRSSVLVEPLWNGSWVGHQDAGCTSTQFFVSIHPAFEKLEIPKVVDPL